MTALLTRRSIEDEIKRLIAALDLMDADADLEDTGDDEFSCGWQNEGSQFHLHFGDDSREPDLGFVGIATGWREGEEYDDREGDDEREPNGDELDCDGGEHDWPGFIAGGQEDGAVSHMFGNPHAEIGGPAHFDGSGRIEARRALRKLHNRKVVRKLLVGGFA